MDIELIDLIVSICLLLGAILYTSVGHAGASIYIAIMALFSVPAVVIKPTALMLNIFVSTFTSWRFIKHGFFDLKVLIPIASGAIIFSFIGGYINISSHFYKSIVGIILVFSAINLIWKKNFKVVKTKKPFLLWPVLSGCGIGFLAGLTGTGGGIFLSPLLLFLNWSDTKKTSGICAVFILINSFFGLLGNFSSVQYIPAELPVYLIATMIGAFIGTSLGIKHYSITGIRKALAVVLIIAGFKLILT